MKHFTGLAHIALFTKDLKTSTAFYEALGGVVTDMQTWKNRPAPTTSPWCRCPAFFWRSSSPTTAAL